MARAALNWSLETLAKAAGVHRNTISNYETERYAGDPEKLQAIQRALEAAGVIFVAENGDGLGVRLKKRSPLVHTVEHLHLLADRETNRKAVPSGLYLQKTNDGLQCVDGDGRVCGRVWFEANVIRTEPSVSTEPFSDRLTHISFRAWVTAARASHS